MNRTIKFRGFNRKDNKWFYGNLSQFDGGGCVINDIAVDPATVGQFTGLLDKNGKEIYEGDVLGCPEDKYFLPETLIFKEGCFMVEDGYTTTAMNLIDERYRTIIGNIHDNPELLNEK